MVIEMMESSSKILFGRKDVLAFRFYFAYCSEWKIPHQRLRTTFIRGAYCALDSYNALRYSWKRRTGPEDGITMP